MIIHIGADWSSQGNEIIFSRHVSPAVFGSIWVVHAGGTDLTQVTFDGNDDDPAWGTHPLAHCRPGPGFGREAG